MVWRIEIIQDPTGQTWTLSRLLCEGKKGRHHIRPHLFSTENSAKVKQTCLCQSVSRKTNTALTPAINDATTVFVFSLGAAGTTWTIQVWKLSNRNRSLPHISSPVPGGRGCHGRLASDRSGLRNTTAAVEGRSRNKKTKRRSRCASTLLEHRDHKMVEWDEFWLWTLLKNFYQKCGGSVADLNSKVPLNYIIAV